MKLKSEKNPVKTKSKAKLTFRYAFVILNTKQTREEVFPSATKNK